MKQTTIEPQQPLDHLASGARVDLLSLATDFNIEADLQKIYPAEVEFFTCKVKNINPLTINNLRSMVPAITAVADTIFRALSWTRSSMLAPLALLPSV